MTTTKKYIGVLLIAACVMPAALAAQRRAQTGAEKPPPVQARGTVDLPPLPPGGPTPRMADGHPDLSGVWFAGTIGKASAWSEERGNRGGAREEPIPFQPWAAEKIKNMSATERQILNPAVACTPVGTPGMFTLNHGYPSQIFTMPGIFVHLTEADNAWRVIHTDGRPHKPADELEPLYNGDETATWDGDTLVIDSISLDERTWISGNGWFHSDQAHVIERLRRPSKNYLEFQYTVEDPKVLTKSWTSLWDTYTLGSEDLIENFCENNENIDQLKKLYEQEQAAKTKK